MGTTHRESGKTIAYTNGGGSTVAVNSVIAIGTMLAVALVDIPVGETGECSVEGVHKLPKTTGVAFTQGEQVIWDVSAQKFMKSNATPATGDVSGAALAWAAALSAADVCYVKLNPALGSVT